MLNASIGEQVQLASSEFDDVGGELDHKSILPHIVDSVCELGELEDSLRSSPGDNRGVGDRWQNIQHMLRQTIHNLRMVTRPDYANKVSSVCP